MGVRLIVEVLDYAPADLTPSELVVLLAIAENANDTTRIGWPGMDVLARRSRLTAVGVRKALARLAKRGYELRMPLGKDKHGEPVYSWPGRRTTYRLPEFSNADTGVSPNADTPVPPSTEEWRYPGNRMAILGDSNGDTPVSPVPSSSFPSKNPQAAAVKSSRSENQRAREDRAVCVVMDSTEATEDEARATVRLIVEERAPTNLVSYIRRIADDGDLDAWLDRAQEAEDDKAWDAQYAQAKRAPDCQHGTPNGSAIHPTTGQSWFCALCRGVPAGQPDPWAEHR